MPLTPSYTWSETESIIRITIDGVPIKDQSQLFCSDRLVKLNAPPYLLLLDLKEPVDDDSSTATVLHGRKVVFQLSKVRHWGFSVAAWHLMLLHNTAVDVAAYRHTECLQHFFMISHCKVM
jgi:hypothetical protein